MKALTKILAGGIGLAALAGAAPAAAQYYPGYPGGGYGGGGLGAIIEQLLGGNRYAYGVDQRTLVNQCIAAVTNRIERSSGYGQNPYGYGGYGGYSGYGYGAGANARVLGITSIERRYNGLRVRGTATANGNMAAQVSPYGNPYGGGYGSPYGGGYGGAYGGGGYGSPYGGGYGGAYGGGYAQPAGELRFKCNIDQRGRITDIDLDRSNYAYGYPYRR